MKGKRSMINLDLLHNKYVLYFAFFIALISVTGYLMSGNFESVAIFLLIGFLTTYFSKNMIIILLTATIATNFLMLLRRKKMHKYREGMTTENTTNEKKDDTTVSTIKTTPDLSLPSAPAAQVVPTAPVAPTAPAVPTNTNVQSSPTTANGPIVQNGSLPSQEKKVQEGMSKLSPSNIGEELSNPMMNKYGSSISQVKEQAMDTLSNITNGGNGVQLNADTSRLVQQQTELMNNLKGLEPLLKTAQGFLDKFESSPLLNKMLGSLTGYGGSKDGPIGAMS